ncbi:MAG: DUF6434 domain-containing protein [Pseudomonadota bacterium]
MSKEPTRPSLEVVKSREEFERWYWPVELLLQFCDRLGVSKVGRKDELRERVACVLAGTEPPRRPRRAVASKHWGTKALSLETVITPGISFGPNVRGFLKSQIGSDFVCHSDFMDWVRENAGATLEDAIEAWHLLEARKDNPLFRREIATCNNFLRYLRDVRDANPQLTLDQAKACWDYKKLRPAQNGYVIYEKADLRYLERNSE